jgi:hypothetical protein
VFACAAVTQAIPGAEFLSGFAGGFLGDASHIEACAGDGGQAGKHMMKFVGDWKSKNINKTADDLQAIISDVQHMFLDCSKAGKDFAPIVRAYSDCRSAGDVLSKLKHNLLDNDENMLEELSKAAKHCSFRDPDGHKCGHALGVTTRHFVIGSQYQQLALEVHPNAFFVGFARGLLGGDGKACAACATDLGKVSKSGMHVVGDIMQRNVSRAVNDVHKLLGSFQKSTKDCKGAVAELKPFLEIMKGVRSPLDLMNKLKHNLLDNDEAILDDFSDVGKYCTFRAPDGGKCGEALAVPIRLVLLGSQHHAFLEAQANSFFVGFAQGLIGGDGKKFVACGHDLGKVLSSGKGMVGDVLARNITAFVQHAGVIVSRFQHAVKDCKGAASELKPYAQILSGVRSPADLVNKLKKNVLDTDEQILDDFALVSKHCTFRDPNGLKCGKALATPVRLVLLGSDKAVVV